MQQCLYKFEATNLLTGRHMELVQKGQRTCVDVRALLGNGFQAFVNMNVKTTKSTKDCVVAVKASVYWYVVTMNISVFPVNIIIHRFDVPRHYRPELTVAQGDKDHHFTTTVSGFAYITVIIVIDGVGLSASCDKSCVRWIRSHIGAYFV
jgi:hypothetical protein